MNADFVNPFIAGLLNVLETMAQTKLTRASPSANKVISPKAMYRG